ncbi:galactoside-binding lectin [Ancylostoma caninum]|uniref:Galectin n=1 Tax=Ancylostoma caninum TaxID=29170 RepID=A0A368G788_ANCCA|nr:galactoside-binding lectin [Ancylostoma caninum]
MIQNFVQELRYKSIAPDSSDPDPIRGERTVFNPVNPVEVPVFGFTYGHRVRVVLETLHKSNCIFKMDLKNGNDIIFHFNPRLKDKLLVFNSYLGGRWQEEERASVVFPFETKKMYTVDLVASGNNSVFVYVNGQLMYEFLERQSGNRVASLAVAGDIHIHSIRVI